MRSKPQLRVRAFGEVLNKADLSGVTGGDAQQGPAHGSDFFWISRLGHRGFAVLGTALPTIWKGLPFWKFILKGLRFHNLLGFGAQGSQFLNTDGTKQKPGKSGGHFCCILPS